MTARILVIEDNALNLKLVRDVLEHAGYVVMGLYTYDARDGKIDIETLFRQHDPDVVIYDIAPPYDRSWLFVRHLVNSSPLAGVPAVFTTTNEKQVRAAAGPSDVIELVGKPYDLEILLNRVKAVTGIHAAG